MMGKINSRAKGAAGEREFCKELAEHLGDALVEPLKRNLEQTRNGGHDILGLGKNTPIATGNLNDALLALDPATGKYTTLRVPYPMGFYAKGFDGRIDDPNAGWKGRGLWSVYGTRTPFHVEGGKGNTAKVVKFQMRPDPLAK